MSTRSNESLVTLRHYRDITVYRNKLTTKIARRPLKDIGEGRIPKERVVIGLS